MAYEQASQATHIDNGPVDYYEGKYAPITSSKNHLINITAQPHRNPETPVSGALSINYQQFSTDKPTSITSIGASLSPKSQYSSVFMFPAKK